MHLTGSLICKLLDYFVKSSYLLCHLHEKGEKDKKGKGAKSAGGFSVHK